MVNIIHTELQQLPSLVFVGRRYGDSDRHNGSYAHLWGQWFDENLFAPLDQLSTEKFRQVCPEADAYLGLMRIGPGHQFEYWIGRFLPKAAPVPQGYLSVNMNSATIGVVWIQGAEPDIYGKEEQALQELKTKYPDFCFDWMKGDWFAERYACPRFTTTDAEGKRILDVIYWAHQ